MAEGSLRFFRQLEWDTSPSPQLSKTEALTPLNFSFGVAPAFRCRTCEVMLVEYSKAVPGPSIDAFL